MYIISICVQRQVRCQKNRRCVYVTHLGSLSGNHGSASQRRRKGHRSLFFTLYTSGLFLSHAYNLSTYPSLYRICPISSLPTSNIFLIPRIVPVSVHIHTNHLITLRPTIQPTKKKSCTNSFTSLSPRSPEMNFVRSRRSAHVRIRPELMRNASGDSL